MAVTNSEIASSRGTFGVSYEVTATADADTTSTFAHGIAGLTNENARINIANLSLVGGVKSKWYVSTIDGTNVVLTKDTAVGSGDPSPQIRVTIERRHSIVF